MNAPKVMGHILPCRAQLTILSIVLSTYSALFCGLSKLSWLLPDLAIWVMGFVGSVEETGKGSGFWTGREVCNVRSTGIATFS